MEKDRRIGYCPHCGNESTHASAHEYETEKTVDVFDAHSGLPDKTKVPELYFLAFCETCRFPLLYRFGEDEADVYDPEPSYFKNARMLWPEVAGLSSAVPVTVRRCYNEAARILRIAPTAYTVQIRRSLEALCEDRGAVKGSLQRRLSDLAFRNEIPKVLADMGDLVRVIGNVGAHADERQISPFDAETIDKFFRSIVEYVYEAPKRVQDFRQRLAKFGKSGAEEADGQGPSHPPTDTVH